MKKVGVIYDPIYAQHDTGYMHPEKAERVIQIYNALRMHQMVGDHRDSHFIELSPRSADVSQILHMHSNDFVNRAKGAVQRAKQIDDLVYLDGDTPVCSETMNASFKATGGNFTAVDAILRGEIDRSFVFCRPPGHHSNRDSARGFCLFNNVALTADYLTREKGIKKVAIVDYDVHAGNGTEEILWNGLDTGEVLMISTHQDPRTLYPFTCFPDEIGEGKQKGKIANITFAPRSGDKCMQLALDQIILPMLYEFKPDFLLISAGFDAHKDDPIGSLSFTQQGFGRIMQNLTKASEDLCQGRIDITLEGGYNIPKLANSVVNVMSVMEGMGNLETEDEFEEDSENTGYTQNKLLPELKQILSPYWKCFK